MSEGRTSRSAIPPTSTNRLFLDTNVVIDYLAHRDPFYEDARKTMLLGALEQAELWTSPSQFSDFFFIVAEGGRASVSADARERLCKLRGFLHVCVMRDADIDAALESGWADLEDALVSRCAVNMGVDYLITRDTHGFEASECAVLTPAEFFERLQRDGLRYEEVFLGGAREDGAGDHP